MSKSKNIFNAFVSGAALGAIIGILFAPDTGKNTRNKLTFLLQKYRKKLLCLINELSNKEKEADINPTKAKVDGKKVIASTKAKAEKLLNDVDNFMNKIKKEK